MSSASKNKYTIHKKQIKIGDLFKIVSGCLEYEYVMKTTKGIHFFISFCVTLIVAILLCFGLRGKVMACRENEGCLQDQYCQKKVGDCQGEGSCIDRPTSCLDVYDPVCGCDCITYSNSCTAASYGVNVEYFGECRVGECMVNEDCLPDDYCQKEDNSCEGQGLCSHRPLNCSRIFRPVCGCDGEIYRNSCFAAAEGVNIAQWSECLGPRFTRGFIRRRLNSLRSSN